jgi:hypothetical protein
LSLSNLAFYLVAHRSLITGITINRSQVARNAKKIAGRNRFVYLDLQVVMVKDPSGWEGLTKKQRLSGPTASAIDMTGGSRILTRRGDISFSMLKRAFSVDDYGDQSERKIRAL